MGLGDILGSISPAYGLFTGKGLGGLARNLNPLYLLLHTLGHHGGGGQQSAPVADQHPAMLPGTTLPVAQPLASLPGPSMAQAAAGMPSMAGSQPGIMQKLGGALQSTSAQDPGISPFDPSFGMMPQSNGLGALLAQILGQ